MLGCAQCERQLCLSHGGGQAPEPAVQTGGPPSSRGSLCPGLGSAWSEVPGTVSDPGPSEALTWQGLPFHPQVRAL